MGYEARMDAAGDWAAEVAADMIQDGQFDDEFIQKLEEGDYDDVIAERILKGEYDEYVRARAEVLGIL